MKFTNNAPGSRAIYAHSSKELSGGKSVWIDPGETVDLDGVSDAEIKNAESQGVTVEKRGPGRPPKEAQEVNTSSERVHKSSENEHDK